MFAASSLRSSSLVQSRAPTVSQKSLAASQLRLPLHAWRGLEFEALQTMRSLLKSDQVGQLSSAQLMPDLSRLPLLRFSSLMSTHGEAQEPQLAWVLLA